MSTKKTKKPTQKALAKTLGISPQLVSYHVKAGCPVPLNDVGGWRDYLAEVGREGSLPENLRKEIGQARARLIRAQAAKAERENKIAARELMPVSDAVRQATEACAFVDSELQRGESELPPIIAGLSAVDCGKILHNFTESVRKNAKAKFQSIGQ